MRFASHLGAAALVFSLSANSVLGAFVAPSYRGDVNTTYQEWNIFTSATAGNLPDVASSNLNGTAALTELTGLGFVTSGGNIYSFSGATSFTVDVPDFDLGGGYLTNAVVQIRTQGTPVDTASFLFNGMTADSATLLYEEALGGFGGSLQDWQFVFSGFAGNLPLDTVTFQASGSSMSLDRISIDTQAVAVPEAGTILLTGVSLLVTGVFIRCRRSK